MNPEWLVSATEVDGKKVVQSVAYQFDESKGPEVAELGDVVEVLEEVPVLNLPAGSRGVISNLFDPFSHQHFIYVRFGGPTSNKFWAFGVGQLVFVPPNEVS